MKPLRATGLLLGTLLVIAPALSAQFWLKREWAKWSSSECREMLSKSPWSGEYQMTTAFLGGVTPPTITYRAQFITAKPIRMAMMRLEQLAPKYARMSDEQKKAFDEQAEKFISADFSGYVVIQLSYVTELAFSGSLAQLWKAIPQEELRKRFVLICAAGRVEALQVNLSSAGSGKGAEFQLVFPRKVNGAAVANLDTKELALEFGSPGNNVILPEKVFIPFKVKNMTFDGELVY